MSSSTAQGCTTIPHYKCPVKVILCSTGNIFINNFRAYTMPCLSGIQEAVGSIPFSSTISKNQGLRVTSQALFFAARERCTIFCGRVKLPKANARAPARRRVLAHDAACDAPPARPACRLARPCRLALFFEVEAAYSPQSSHTRQALTRSPRSHSTMNLSKPGVGEQLVPGTGTCSTPGNPRRVASSWLMATLTLAA
jgi:hypothetical protein